MLRLLVIALVVLLMYKRTAGYKYIIDDMEVEKPKDQETKGLFRRFWEHFRGKKYTDSRLAHNISTLIHTINCMLIYKAFGSSDVSFLAALLFGLNPVTNQGAVWLSGKPYSLSTTILLLGLWLLPILPFIYGFAVWLSPNALFFPFIFIMKQPIWYAPLLLAICIYASKKFRGVFKTRLDAGTDEMTLRHPKKIILVFKTLGYYFLHCLFPIHIGMCHEYLHTFGLTPGETDKWYKLDGYFWLGILLSALGVFVFFKPYNDITYGYLWFLILIIQFCNFIMVNHPITERYVYLATVGLMYMLANVIIGSPLMWVFLTFYLVRLHYFLPAYKDSKNFWKSNTENFPKVAMGYNQYGLGLINFGNTGSAIDTWIAGIQLRPKDFRLSFNLANVMIATGNTQQAVQFLRTAEESLDKKQNYDFWIAEINKMKEAIKQRGIQYDTLQGNPG